MNQLNALSNPVEYVAARHKGRRPEGLRHGIDSFCETNTSRPLNFIKSESEPKRDPVFEGPHWLPFLDGS